MDKTGFRFALDAHRRGWHIFPCEPQEKTGALLYPGTDKPWRVKWYETATNDINQIISWWTKQPNYNIGVSCKKSGLLVVDCDVPKPEEIEAGATEDGWDQFAKLCAGQGVDWEDALDTYQVETPSKGVHLYYYWPEDVHASQASLDTLLDVRTNGGEKGGYVLGAGSNANGWYHVINPAPIKAAPDWLVDECTYQESVQHSRHPFTRPHTISSAGLHEAILKAPEGNRNNALHWAVAQFAEENPDLTSENIYNEFVEDAVEVGLTLPEISGTVMSAYRKVHYG